MDDIADERVGPMLNPPHLGELIRESMDEEGWNVTVTAAPARVRAWHAVAGAERGRRAWSANMALALEDLGWGHRRALDADAGEL